MLNNQQTQTLLGIARQTLEKHLNVPPTAPAQPDELQDPALNRKQPVFVTLTKGGQLRGCIGNLVAKNTIINGVKENSINAAFHDSRFPPLEREELDILKIDISVLSEPQPLTHGDDDELVGKLRPGVDGVIINAANGAGATFLPQVWAQIPDPVIFMNHLCQKAGLSESAWTGGGLEVSTYQVQKFKEDE